MLNAWLPRGVGRVLAACGACVLAGASLTPQPARADDPAGYAHFALRAVATGAQALYSVPGALPVDPLVEAASLFSEAILDRTRSTGLAAAPSPGSTVLSAPGLIDGFTAGATDLPEYPLVVRAEYPLVPEASTTVGPVVLDARADDDGADSRAQQSGAFGGGEVSTSTSTRADPDGGLEVRAVSAVSNLDVLGGLVTVGAVRSVAVVRFEGGQAEVLENHTTVSDLRIAGSGLSIGDDGLVVADQPIDLGPVLGVLGQQGDAAGLQVRALAPTEVRTDRGVTAWSGSLVIELPGEVLGQASTTQLVLGSASASASARARPSSTAAPSPTAARPAAAPSPPLPAAATLFSSPPSAGAPRPAAPAAPAVTTARPAVAGVPAANPLTPIDFRPVYLWLVALGVAAVRLQRWTLDQARRRQVGDLRPLWRW